MVSSIQNKEMGQGPEELNHEHQRKRQQRNAETVGPVRELATLPGHYETVKVATGV